MTMTDPIADMLTRIRNANVAMHDEVKMPGSKLKQRSRRSSRARATSRTSRSPTPRPARVRRSSSPASSTVRGRARDLRAIKRVTKPGCASTPRPKVPPVVGGLGVAVLSTSQGLLSDRIARKRRIGGEVLCKVY